MVAFSVVEGGLVAGEGKYSYLPESLESDFEGEPAKRIGRFGARVNVTVVDEQVVDNVLEEVKEDDSY